MSDVFGRDSRFLVWPALIAAALCVAYLLSVAGRQPADGDFDLTAFAQTPVSYKGRVKPLDSVARDCLMVLSNRQTLRHEEAEVPPVKWLLDTLSGAAIAVEYRIFRIVDPQVVEHLRLPEADKSLYSAADLEPVRGALAATAQQAFHVQARDRTAFQRNIIELATRLQRFDNLPLEMHMIPPQHPDGAWTTFGDAVAQHQMTGQAPTAAIAWGGVMHAYEEQEAPDFNRIVADFHHQLEQEHASYLKKASFETYFNRVAPFYQGMVLYVLVGLLAALAWFPLGAASQWLRSASLGVLVVVLVLHTAGLIARIYLSGRPPVTNLYSSAVFIGWGTVVACLALEWIFRTGITTVVAAVAGFVTLLIAHHLASSGDTMAVLVAVLDTNIWLATHVIIITIGYSATYLAGLLGIAYIIAGVATPGLTPRVHKILGQMIYGVICFALLGSFVGTVLGGIWADQSWGRFWGWDPKENGALLIVLWCALMLHARWGGMVKARGMAVMAIFGNIVTSWSWFGTNMLGVGLHSYGFIDSALFWLVAFVASQLCIMAIGCLPLRFWMSFAQRQAPALPPAKIECQGSVL